MDAYTRAPVYLFSNFALDTGRRSLQRDGVEVSLRPKSYDVLVCLTQSAGQTVSKEQLFAAVWANVIVTEDSLTRCVSDIRAALGDARQDIIKTVPRRGYLMACPMHVKLLPDPANIPADSIPPPQPQLQAPAEAVPQVPHGPPNSSAALAGHALFRRTGWVVAALLASLGLFWGVTMVNAPSRINQAPRLSIVVLPLTSHDAAQAYFAEALTEDLTTDLSRIPGSFVIARSSAYAYAAQPRDLRKIGEELGVRYALNGSVQRLPPDASQGVQLNVQLVDTQSGREIWAERFEGQATGLAGLQKQVTGKIARTLHLELMEAESTRGRQTQTKNPSQSPEAQDLVLQAWSLYEQRTPASVAAARQLLERALVQDAQSALGWSLLSDTYTADLLNRWLHLHNAKREDWLHRAQQAADEAMAIDPNNLYATGSRATVLQLQGQPQQALAMLERQVELNRNYAPA